MMRKTKELEYENKRLQNCYDSVCAFRHDFFNIVQAMGGYVEAKDIVGLEEMYHTLAEECQEINEEQAINKNIINNPAIYNLISQKYNIAKEYNIKMKVEVLIDLNNLNVNKFDLVRILGILIDNAIEAAKKSEERIVSVEFKYDGLNSRSKIYIKNSYNKLPINMEEIYQKGNTTKNEKENHGLGLWIVKQIIKKYKSINLYTNVEELFIQEIEIYD